jgi:hypothetical protein
MRWGAADGLPTTTAPLPRRARSLPAPGRGEANAAKAEVETTWAGCATGGVGEGAGSTEGDAATGGSTAGGGGAGSGGTGAGGATGGGGVVVARGGSRVRGSTYVSPSTRTPRWTYGTSCSGVPEEPGSARGSPSCTGSPRATRSGPRCISETLSPPPVRIVTVSPCVGTRPANDTSPSTGARMTSDSPTAMSTPRCCPAAYGSSPSENG